jgi:exodeoxyribonuclease VII large subunit
MTSEDLFTAAQKAEELPKQALSNVPEMSVSDLALSLKRTLEQTFGHIRVRGELSGIKVAASGHLYGDIKDVDANINIVCWRGTLSKLSVKPEDGMDVVVTGRVSSYPKSSRYQIVIEKMELAGEGALLKLLEERRKKLAAEGLFDSDRKKPLPFLPEVIGVVTSPTGAVIRDIMHRLKDRFPRHVLLWPVMVQGQGADEQIANAINGFNALKGPDIRRPDIIIVARGGGSLEDLMAFNEENVVRAVANSNIPVISAVGHETDTTLIDYAADLRAPTPTGAAEMAVPVRMNLVSQIQDDFERLISAMTRMVSDRQNRMATLIAKLGDPRHLLESKAQHIDHLGDKLSGALRSHIHVKKALLQDALSHFISPKYVVENKKTQLKGLERTLNSLSPKGVLDRGYALVYDAAGELQRNSANIEENQEIRIEFAEGDKIAAKAGKRLKT